jgi:hypothetical protein
VSGLPTRVTPRTKVPVECAGPGGACTAELIISVSVSEPRIQYASEAEVLLRLGEDMAPLLPSNAGSPADSFTAHDLPLGLRIDEASGEISGRPEELCSQRLVAVVARNSAGEHRADLSFTVVPHPPLLTYVPIRARVGEPLDASPVNGGGAVDDYLLEDTVPAGLAFDRVSGRLFGVPREAGLTRLAITARNTGGEERYELSVEILPARPALSYPDLSAPLLLGQQFAAEPSLQGGPVERFEAVSLPRGVDIDSATGQLAGAPEEEWRGDAVVAALQGAERFELAVPMEVVAPAPTVSYPALSLTQGAPLLPAVAPVVEGGQVRSAAARRPLCRAAGPHAHTARPRRWSGSRWRRTCLPGSASTRRPARSRAYPPPPAAARRRCLPTTAPAWSAPLSPSAWPLRSPRPSSNTPAPRSC